ncbi:hypothetical protein B005_4368 [Nocardiopsis alba ATCC BAA-2165]|uniref:Uncharacterized protein n=1 Tax=Nocardiopsis alba (strain ATCC BAA-2165 / BE74) TaxID=1205910 RepID=J7L8B2_NOCAA|nr:hypothetical protein B005_4368 [Nocardiopsis alba ATCC BAA-2165]
MAPVSPESRDPITSGPSPSPAFDEPAVAEIRERLSNTLPAQPSTSKENA